MNKKLILATIFIAFSTLIVKAQEKAFHAFAVQGKYGITDSHQKEMVAPNYADFKVNQIGKFYLLKNDTEALLFRYTDGLKLEFDRIASKTISLNRGVFYSADRGNKTVLIDEYDLKEKELPNTYAKIYGDGYILLAEQTENPKTNDVIHIDRPSEIVTSKQIDTIFRFSKIENNNTTNTTRGELYGLNSGDKTYTYDEQLKLLHTFEPKLKDNNEFKKRIAETLNINIKSAVENPVMLSGMLPYNTIDADHKDGRTYFFKHNDESKKPLFDILGTAKATKHESCVEKMKPGSDEIDTFFCVDTRSSKIFLPAKYFKEVDLKVADKQTK